MILVVTHIDHAEGISREIQACVKEKGLGKDVSERILVLSEPAARNTAPAIALACRFLEHRYADIKKSDRTVIVLPADHMIENLEVFREDVEKASNLASAGKLVTFGLKPLRPETGYGYIEVADPFLDGFVVHKFHEKPDEEKAKEYVRAGRFYWNSGIFTFPVDTMQAELEKFEPGIYDAIARYTFEGISPEKADTELYDIYEKVPSLSIDYAVMEKTERAAMVPASFDWSDVGSWDEVARIFEGKERGEDTIFSVNSDNNYVLSDMPVALVGIRDMIVVQRGNVLLLCKRGESQRIKNLVSDIERRGKEEFL